MIFYIPKTSKKKIYFLMKKTLLSMMALLIGSLSAHADFVSKEEAKAKAQNFISQRMMRAGNGSLSKSNAAGMKKDLVCVSDEAKPAYYIFNYADSTGFVIVSAESNTLEILAYSDQDYFHEEDIDKGAEVFLAQYERDAAIARANALTEKQREYVRNATRAAASGEVVLETACLNQSDGYWDMKYSPLQGAPAGCTATAAAIIMHYHQWPAQGKGSNAYVSNTHGLKLSRDFSQDTYNWSCIPKTPYYLGGWSEEAKNEVPKILLACGIACNMNYDYDGSGASTNRMLSSMVENFSYAIGFKKYIYSGNSYADMTEAWQAARNSIDNNMPVLVSASGDRGAHAFVLDGYNSQYYHYNMGWGGSNNGWWSNGSISYNNYKINEIDADICPQTGKVVISGTTSDGMSYSINDGGVLRISGNGKIGESLNERIKDYHITECIIEEGVTAIRDYSLSYFNISKLTIPSTVREIGRYALPSGIGEVTVAAGNAIFSSPGNYCLYDKVKKRLMNYSYKEAEIRFPEGVEILGNNLFEYNDNITEIEIPEGVKSIESDAFFYTINLQKVTLPSTLKTMESWVFAYAGIKTITCKAIYPPSGAYELFYNTNVGTEGTLYVPYYGGEKYAEDSEWNIFHVIDVIPGSENWDNPYMANVEVTTAGTLRASMGSDAADIRELTISGPINGTDLKFIRELCSSANDNRSLSILDLSKARIVAGGEAYYIDSSNHDYILSEDDIIPDYAFVYCKLDKLIIPETTKRIGMRVLPDNLKSIDLPEGLKRIESDAFWNSMYLESLHIPASVEYIGESMSAASWYLTEMDVDKDNKYYKSEGNIIYTIDGKTIVAAAIINDEVLNIPEGVENIYSNTFYGSNFKKLCLPSTLTNISYYGFYYTSTLKEVTCLATVPPEAWYAFDNVTCSSCVLYVPSASIDSYKQADQWSEFYQIKDLTASGIEETIQSPSADSKRVIYDLSGRRISNTESLRPGIYIINGKKIRR